jgi:hypothetical protein
VGAALLQAYALAREATDLNDPKSVQGKLSKNVGIGAAAGGSASYSEQHEVRPSSDP